MNVDKVLYIVTFTIQLLRHSNFINHTPVKFQHCNRCMISNYHCALIVAYTI